MCKRDKDCEAGQRCVGGTCAGTAADELADTEPLPKIEPATENTPSEQGHNAFATPAICRIDL